MAKNPTQMYTIRGKASFMKVLGEPVPNFNKDGKEWTFDVQITEDTEKEMKKAGLRERIKQKATYLNNEPYMSFKQKATKYDESDNDPIPVVDIYGKPWNREIEIGNGSDIDVRFAVVDFGPGRKQGVYPRAIRVLKLVEYVRKGGFDPVDENDPFFEEAAKTPKENTAPSTDTDFDDDVPF